MLNFVKREPNEVNFKSLKCGDTFKQCDIPYIKLKTFGYDNDEPNAVNLETGTSIYFKEDLMVVPVEYDVIERVRCEN